MEQVAPIIGFSHDPVSPCYDWYKFYEWRASGNAWIEASAKPPAAAACLSIALPDYTNTSWAISRHNATEQQLFSLEPFD